MRKDLTFEQSIGQHLVAGLTGTTLDDGFRDLVHTCKVGNVILHPRNIENRGQLTSLCKEIRQLIIAETGVPPIIAIDEEGGMVGALPEETTRLPGAMAIGATGDQGNAFTCGYMIAEELRAMGIQCDLAPVLDVNTNRLNRVIGVRSYSDDAKIVAEFGSAMARGLDSGKVIPVAKHFPGHGGTEIDSHIGLPTMDKTKEEMEECELVPFTTAIKNGIPAIMTGHILYPGLEEAPIPASMSRNIVTELLRNELGHQGLAITDCLEMGAITEQFGTVHAAVEAIRAGNDLLLISHTDQLVRETFDALAVSYGNSYLDWEEHEQSVARIIDIKERYGSDIEPSIEVVGSQAHREVAKAIMARAICIGNLPHEQLPELGTDPLHLGCEPFKTSEAMDRSLECEAFPLWMARHLGGKALVTSADPSKDEIIALMEEIGNATSIVMGTYNGHLNQGQLALANAMAGTGLPVVVVALRNPYDLVYLAENIHSFAAFEYSPLAFEAIRCILRGERSATGVLPIHW